MVLDHDTTATFTSTSIEDVLIAEHDGFAPPYARTNQTNLNSPHRTEPNIAFADTNSKTSQNARISLKILDAQSLRSEDEPTLFEESSLRLTSEATQQVLVFEEIFGKQAPSVRRMRKYMAERSCHNSCASTRGKHGR